MKFQMLAKATILSVSFIAGAQSMWAMAPIPLQTFDVLKAEGKKLTVSEMNLLDTVLQGSPIGIVRMDIAYKTALKVLTELNKLEAQVETKAIDAAQEKVFLSTQMSSILAPVKEFFDEVHSYVGIIKPLIFESLMGKVRNVQTVQDALIKDEKDCLFLKFFQSPESATNFFETFVKTRADLRLACNEFIVFFKDMRKNLSPKAIDAYRKMIDEIKKNQKTATPK